MQEYLVTLLGGLVTTLELTLFSLLLGIVLAALMTWVLELRLPVATQLVQLWVLLFTGTPLLIQIFLIYYGPGQFEWLKASPLWPLLKQPWFCAVLALGLNTAAYSTRLFKGSSPGSAPCWRWVSTRRPTPPGCSRGRSMPSRPVK